MFARAALSVLADELDPPGRWRSRKRAAPRSKPGKQPKEPPKAQPNRTSEAEPKRPKASPKPSPHAEPTYAAPQSAESAGWGETAEAPSVPVIRIETDVGTTVSPLSVIGDRAYVAPRAQRERKPGESRRARRSARTEDPEPTPLPRTPEMTAAIERMRARASRTVVPARGEDSPTREAHPSSMPAPRRRPPGKPLALTQLAPATLLLLQSGEPLKDAARAA